MVLPDSDGVSRAPQYSGSVSEGARLSATGLLPSLAGLSRPLRLTNSFVTPCETSYNPKEQAPWFGLFRVRSPLLTESLLFSLPQGT